MVRHKIQILLISLIFFASLSTALVFDVSVEGELNHDFKQLQYQENVTNIQNINVSVMNTGSIGCRYRLRAVINDSSKPVTRYSSAEPLWPGQTANLKLYHLPKTLGEREVNLSLRTCSGWEKKGKINYTVENISENQREVKVKTVESSKEEIKVKTNVSEGLVVPIESPSFWKTSHSRIKGEKANLTYDPEIYNPEENITYSVVNESTGDVIGEFEVSVAEKKGLLDKLDIRYVYVLLIVSIIMNLAFIYRYRPDFGRLRS